MELVRAIECLISLAVTAFDKARVLGDTMLFAMPGEVTGAGEGGGTPWLVAYKAVGIGVGAGRSCGSAAGGNRQFSKVRGSLRGVSVCGAIQFRSGSGESCGVVEAIRAFEAIKAAEAIRAADVINAAEVRKLEGCIELLVRDRVGIRESIVIESQRRADGAIEVISVCCNVTGALSNWPVSRAQRGRVDNSIGLATIGIICILMLEIRLVQGIGVNRDEVASSYGRITLTRNRLMTESVKVRMCDVKIAVTEGQKREDDGMIEMTSIRGNVISGLRIPLVGPVQRRRAQSSIDLKAIGGNCISSSVF